MTDAAAAPREWDARGYDRVAAPVMDRGDDLLETVALRGDETVLDAGCGTGRLLARLLERLPDGRVVGIDASREMLARARERLGGHPRAELVRADLSRPLPIAGPADVVVSGSTFHWVRDHDALFASLARTLRPGGLLVAECGGAGNCDRVMEALRDLGETWLPWRFASPEETWRASRRPASPRARPG